MKSSEFIIDHKIDNYSGLGATPHNTDIDYFGFKVKMTPSMFLKIAAPGGGDSVEHIATAITDGKAIAAPMLYIAVPAEWKNESPTQGTPMVVGHEGRNRMMAIRKVEGNEPIEVHIILQSRGAEWRARHITPEIKQAINAGVMDELNIAVVQGPIYEI